MTHPIIEFIEARLLDLDRAARATLWDGSGNRPSWGLAASAVVDLGAEDFFAGDSTVAAHIVLHDPHSVLADVAVKRAILAEHIPHDGYSEPIAFCITCLGTAKAGAYPCETVRLLASLWSGHPGYRAEWARDMTTEASA